MFFSTAADSCCNGMEIEDMRATTHARFIETAFRHALTMSPAVRP